MIYAASQSWTAVHFDQFIGMAVITGGLLALHFAVLARDGLALWLNRFALLSAGVAVALYGVLQAVDGVGLKHAVDAWPSARDADKAVRFDAAETVRWLEWAMRNYQSFVFGLALIFFGIVIVLLRPVPRLIGYLMASRAFATSYKAGLSAQTASPLPTKSRLCSESSWLWCGLSGFS